jgi:DNA-directed RNA polymerase specialized sigma24 family protein
MTRVLDALEADPPARRQFRVWARAEPVLSGLDLDTLRSVLLDDTPPVDYEHRDALLAALVRLARTDKDAGRALIICLLPGIKGKLRRHTHGMNRDDAAQEILTALWRRITRYPLDRRPRKIASNLLLDALHDFITTRKHETAWHHHTALTGEPHDLDTPAPDPGYSPRLMWDAALDAQVLSRPQVTLIDATRLGGLALPDTARLLGVNHEAAKKSRRRGETRWAAWWAPDDRRHAA